MGIDFALLEAAQARWSDNLAVAVPKLLQEFQNGRRPVTAMLESGEQAEDDQPGDTNCESEWSLVGNKILIARYRFVHVAEELRGETDGPSMPARPVRKLEQHKPGLASTLCWKAIPAQPLGDEEVRVDVKAVGLNFKDALISLGVVAETAAIGDGLGCECAGVVSEVGSGVTKHRVGDRVVMNWSGSFTTSHTVSQYVRAKIPDEMAFEEAAVMPAVYCTAIYGLIDAGRLSKGMTVLIISATGGVRISAIQLAKMLEAKIYCTVGNHEKDEFLFNTMGIPREHIFNSRDASFLPAVMEATEGRGTHSTLARWQRLQRVLFAGRVHRTLCV